MPPPADRALIETSSGVHRAVSPEEARRTDAVLQKAMEADPALVNELGQEKWWQSGVGVFGAGGVIWSLGAILTQVGDHGLDIGDYDLGLVVTATGSLASFAAVIYRRYAPGLKPLFHGWFT